MGARITIETRTGCEEVWYYTFTGRKLCAACADPDPSTGEGRHPDVLERKWGPDDSIPGSPCDYCGKFKSAVEFEGSAVIEHPPCRIF